MASVPHRSVLVKVPSGEIAMEIGADGVFLRFDCDCMDALPHCKAACCSLHGISVTHEEAKQQVSMMPKGTKVPMASLTVIDPDDGPEMIRGSDGWCQCIDRGSRLCRIYASRPDTCKDFHCTKGPGVRGWKLGFTRHASHED